MANEGDGFSKRNNGNSSANSCLVKLESEIHGTHDITKYDTVSKATRTRVRNKKGKTTEY